MCACSHVCVRRRSKNERISANFGQKPFAFDIEALVVEERLTVRKLATSVDIPPRFTHDVVRQYLEHYGCSGTLAALLDASHGLPSGPPTSGSQAGGDPPVVRVDVEKRAEVRGLLLGGDVQAAVLKVQKEYPKLWKVCPIFSLPFCDWCPLR
eukprot:2549468-Pyramimonas_sp.AAC.1